MSDLFCLMLLGGVVGFFLNCLVFMIVGGVLAAMLYELIWGVDEDEDK